MIVVIPVELAPRWPAVERTAVPPAALECAHVDLATKPDEALKDTVAIALTRPVTSRVSHVLNAGVGARALVDLKIAGEERIRLREIRPGNEALRVVGPHRQTRIRSVSAAAHGERRRGGVSHVEKAVHIVGVPHPRRLDRRIGTVGELMNLQVRIELWPPALIGAVVDAAALAVEEAEPSASALAVLVLIRGDDRWLLESIECVQFGAYATSRVLPLLRRDEDDPVRGARAVQRCGVRALEHRHRFDVVGIEIVDGAA